MNPRMPRYREVRPGPALVPYVQCYWSITASTAASFWNRVCPDGCADVVIDLAAPLPNRSHADGLATYAVGTMQHATQIALGGTVHLLGVRFRPGAAERFFRLPMHELTDRTTSLSDIWGDAGALERAVRSACSDRDRMRRLEEGLLWRLRGSEHPAPMLRRAIGFIGETGGTRSISELEEATGVGGRRLERQFRNAVGVTPKVFSRVVRFRRTLMLMRRPGAMS